MKNNDQTTQRERGRSFAQDMQQAFVDWVKQLRFIKNDIPQDPEREPLDGKSADKASVPRTTDGASAEGPLDHKESQL
jgi:hypothetical protein